VILISKNTKLLETYSFDLKTEPHVLMWEQIGLNVNGLLNMPYEIALTVGDWSVIQLNVMSFVNWCVYYGINIW
jgi:hypothetical protein